MINEDWAAAGEAIKTARTAEAKNTRFISFNFFIMASLSSGLRCSRAAMGPTWGCDSGRLMRATIRSCTARSLLPLNRYSLWEKVSAQALHHFDGLDN
jgi:hypothetical protein